MASWIENSMVALGIALGLSLAIHSASRREYWWTAGFALAIGWALFAATWW